MTLKIREEELCPQLNTYTDENDLNVDDDILEVMKCHESMINAEICHYFANLQDFDKYHLFINNPFALAFNDLLSDDNLIQVQFIDLINEKHIFRDLSISDFWIQMVQSYPEVANLALKVMIPFANTYECETAFSA